MPVMLAVVCREGHGFVDTTAVAVRALPVFFTSLRNERSSMIMVIARALCAARRPCICELAKLLLLFVA